MSKKDLKIFALIWGGIFITLAYSSLISKEEYKWGSLFIGFMFIVIGLFKPLFLSSFYSVWIKIGDFIGGIVSKIILFFLFYFIFTPISVFFKLINKDLLNKSLNKDEQSYWVERKNQPQSMKNQF